MRVSLGWLAEWVDLPSPDRLAETLTLAGLEVEALERSGPDLSGIVVGRVVDCRAHPDADRLRVCEVDWGQAEPAHVVCGAPNVAAGQLIAFVPAGQRLPDGTRLKRARIRGQVSEGMICSDRELGLGEDQSGIRVLDADATVGAPLAEAIECGDTVLDVAITPNRGDCASMLGIAREVQALFGGELRLPEIAPEVEQGAPAAQAIGVRISDRAGCPRYAARVVRGVRVGPSPEALRARLEAAGHRSINNVVDVTNLVLAEWGQPLHAFDLASIRGAEVEVRSARPDEKIATLDGETRSLLPGDLVIADRERAVAIAGILGGAETEVRPGTCDVLLESAHFDPSRIRRTARRLGVQTESSYRFERGIDREGIERALDRAARLIADLAGGQVAPGRVSAEGDPAPAAGPIELEFDVVNRLLGTQLSESEIRGVLSRLGIEGLPANVPGRAHFQVPSWRNDLQIGVDLVEEVARIHGYDRIPTTVPEAPLCGATLPPLMPTIERARDSLWASGAFEILSLPVSHRRDADALRLAADDPRRPALALLNPLVEDEDRLRTSLLPAVLRAASMNLARQVDEVRLFEVGPVFLRAGSQELPAEREALVAVWIQGDRKSPWEPDPRPAGFFELKGVAERLLEDLSLDGVFEAGSTEPYLHPRVSCEIRCGKHRLGALGELHPETAEAFGIEAPCAVLELDLESVPQLATRPPRYREVSRHPAVRRDLAWVFDADCAAGDILAGIRKAGGSSLVSVDLFDRYGGEAVGEGRVSLAFRLIFQRPDRTLTEDEVARFIGRIEGMLEKRFQGARRSAANGGVAR
ncbi:MAG: phenylalanine--tRNA ligase subunit beta [Myxococcota bacterium]